jgi:arylsulfatase A
MRKSRMSLLLFVITAKVSIVADLQHNGIFKDPLNVILIMTDDQGYGNLAAHGCSKSRTPQIDALPECLR